MIIAVVGNRIGWTYEQVKIILDRYVKATDILISGGAKGVDQYTEEYAKIHNITIKIYPPNLAYSIPERFFVRNCDIAGSCDLLIAFDKKKGRSGTKNTIRYARTFAKPIVLIDN